MTTIRSLGTDIDELWVDDVASREPARPSKTTRRRRWWQRPLLVLALAVLVAELGVRLADLPDPLVFSSEEAQVKAEELSAAGQRGGVDTVFVGSSVADVAIEPAPFAEGAGVDDAYNAALLGADLRSLELWTRHVVVPEASPRRVVLALSCRELNGLEGAQDDYFRDFAGAPAIARLTGDEPTLDRVDRAIGEWSELVRYRTVLRVPRNLGGRDMRSGENLELVDGGYNAAYRDRSYPDPSVLHDVLNPGDRSWEVGPDRVAALDRTLLFLQQSGVEAVVVHMPVTADWIGYLPSPEAFDQCGDVLADTASAGGATFVDGGVLDRQLFADPIHVNGAGSAHVTDFLAGALGPGRGGGP
jgi:hypothetical protein